MWSFQQFVLKSQQSTDFDTKGYMMETHTFDPDAVRKVVLCSLKDTHVVVIEMYDRKGNMIL